MLSPEKKQLLKHYQTQYIDLYLRRAQEFFKDTKYNDIHIKNKLKNQFYQNISNKEPNDHFIIETDWQMFLHSLKK